MCDVNLEQIRDDMVATLAGAHPQLNFSDSVEAILAIAISAWGSATLPSLPATIRHRSSADRLAEIVFDKVETCANDPDGLVFLFSTLNALRELAPDWFNSEDYLNEISTRLSAIWPDIKYTPLGPQNTRDWRADTDIILLRRIGLSQADEHPVGDRKYLMMQKILAAIKDANLTAPYANTLCTLDALKRRNIRWPEFVTIERSMRMVLREKPGLAGLAGLAFVDI